MKASTGIVYNTCIYCMVYNINTVGRTEESLKRDTGFKAQSTCRSLWGQKFEGTATCLRVAHCRTRLKSLKAWSLVDLLIALSTHAVLSFCTYTIQAKIMFRRVFSPYYREIRMTCMFLYKKKPKQNKKKPWGKLYSLSIQWALHTSPSVYWHNLCTIQYFTFASNSFYKPPFYTDQITIYYSNSFFIQKYVTLFLRYKLSVNFATALTFTT